MGWWQRGGSHAATLSIPLRAWPRIKEASPTRVGSSAHRTYEVGEVGPIGTALSVPLSTLRGLGKDLARHTTGQARWYPDPKSSVALRGRNVVYAAVHHSDHASVGSKHRAAARAALRVCVHQIAVWDWGPRKGKDGTHHTYVQRWRQLVKPTGRRQQSVAHWESSERDGFAFDDTIVRDLQGRRASHVEQEKRNVRRIRASISSRLVANDFGVANALDRKSDGAPPVRLLGVTAKEESLSGSPFEFRRVPRVGDGIRDVPTRAHNSIGRDKEARPNDLRKLALLSRERRHDRNDAVSYALPASFKHGAPRRPAGAVSFRRDSKPRDSLSLDPQENRASRGDSCACHHAATSMVARGEF